MPSARDALYRTLVAMVRLGPLLGSSLSPYLLDSFAIRRLCTGEEQRIGRIGGGRIGGCH